MTKISKNIKRLRNTQNISQEALAEKLFISRQAVSSWENDRTQPDIEMIGKLADVFNVSIEELIYGEKRKLELENEEPKQNNKLLIIIFSVLGSLFVAIGIIFFIFFGWEHFGVGVKAFLGLLPMLAGQAVAVFTFLKKRHSVAFSESGALVWSVGVVSTIFLINGILGIDVELFVLLAISAILILPGVYIFNSVSTLVGFFGLVLTAIPNSINDLLTIVFLVASMFLGVSFTRYNRGKVDEFRHNFSVWISTISVLIAVFELLIAIQSTIEILSISSVYIAIFTVFLISCKERNFQKPFYLFGTLGLMGTLIFLTMISSIDSVGSIFEHYRYQDLNIVPHLIIHLITIPTIMGIGAYSARTTLVKNPLKITILLLSVVSAIFAVFCGDVFVPFAIILTITLAICYIILGSKSNKLYEVNLGLLAIIIIMFRIITDIGSDYLLLGFTFLLSGAVLFIVNFLLLRKSKKEKELPSVNSQSAENTDGGASND